jgi:heme/copper-type cytochrome/quinol oxidase subunit 2
MVLVLWGAAVGVMTIAWRVQRPGASDGALVLALAAFMAAPVIAIVVTMVWRHKRDRERMHTRRLRRSGTY